MIPPEELAGKDPVEVMTIVNRELERLILRRRSLLRDPSAAPRHAPSEQPVVVDESIDEFARGGFAALAQIGAELEAIIVGPPVSRPEPAAPPVPVVPKAEPTVPVAPPESLPGTLGALESELADMLMREGIVVRGLDVARVVAVATGREVTWAA